MWECPTSCYAMSVPLISQFSASHGYLHCFHCTNRVLTQAPELFLRKEQGLILYLCGNYPIILPDLFRFSERFVVRRALTAFQILTILDDAYQSFIIIEHDRSLFEERADLLPIIGHRCKEHAARAYRRFTPDPICGYIHTGPGTLFSSDYSIQDY